MEAYRVLKMGSAACFTIWGQPENCQKMNIIVEVMQNHLTSEDEKARIENRNFVLFRNNASQLKAEMQEIGFKDIKIWEQPINVIYRSGEEYMAKFGFGTLNRLIK